MHSTKLFEFQILCGFLLISLAHAYPSKNGAADEETTAAPPPTVALSEDPLPANVNSGGQLPLSPLEVSALDASVQIPSDVSPQGPAGAPADIQADIVAQVQATVEAEEAHEANKAAAGAEFHIGGVSDVEEALAAVDNLKAIEGIEAK